MHPYSHILSPIQVGNLLLPTRLTSSAGAHYSQELPNRALNGASVIYISHIMLKTSLLASVANPNGGRRPRRCRECPTRSARNLTRFSPAWKRFTTSVPMPSPCPWEICPGAPENTVALVARTLQAARPWIIVPPAQARNPRAAAICAMTPTTPKAALCRAGRGHGPRHRLDL